MVFDITDGGGDPLQASLEMTFQQTPMQYSEGSETYMNLLFVVNSFPGSHLFHR